MSFSLSGLNTVLFALAPGPHRTQQFQKNAYHNDKCVISEPVQKPSTGPTRQDLHSCGGKAAEDESLLTMDSFRLILLSQKAE
jgi:hypothetical protein